MKKKLVACTLTAVCLSLGVLAGCTKMVSIQSIEKTGSIGLEDYYTITYTDGTTSGFTVTNGAKGEDGKDATEFTVQELYDFYIQNGGTGSIEQFIENFSLKGEKEVSVSAFKSCLLSTMKVYSVFKEGGSSAETGYAGAGVIYKMESDYTYIVTNYHVVYDKLASTNKISNKIFAYMYGTDGEPKKTGGVYIADANAISCQYIGGSVTADIAVMRARTEDILAKNPQACAVKVNHGYSVQDTVYAVGNPGDNGISITKGIVSVDSEEITLNVDGQLRYYRSLRTDAGLNHGSSGGGLFNEAGELIAITNSGDTVTVDGTEVPLAGMNYAIPATIVTGVADGLIYYYLTEGISNTKTLYLGMTTEERNTRYVYDAEKDRAEIVADIFVTSVDHRAINGFLPSASQKVAKAMGLKAGDRLISFYINGEEYAVKRLFTVKELLYTLRVGDKIKFRYSREGQEAESAEHTVTGANLFNPDSLSITA